MKTTIVRARRALLAGALVSTGLAGASAQTVGTPPTSHRLPHFVPQSALPAAEIMPAIAKTYSGTKIDVPTYHYDTARTGWNQSETDLTPASVASGKFGLLTTLAVDGNVLAQPLLISNFVMPGGSTHDVLVIATGHDTVYAFDAASFAILWQVSLGTSQNSNDVGCGDIVPEYGIDNTPVIVRAGANAATIYVVSATEPSSGQFHHTLHALDLGTGADLVAPVEIAPQAKLSNGAELTFDPQNQYVRASLAYANGQVLVGVTSHCDRNAGNISGWLLGYDAATLRLKHPFHTIETPQGGTELAAIWMSGFAPAIDDAGHVFVVTGNGDYAHPGRDWGESALKLSPSLSVSDRFTDSDYQNLNDSDEDFGSGGIMLLPPVAGQTAPPMAVAIGKNDNLYLLDQNRMGGLKANDGGALQAQNVSGEGVWGGPAFYDSSAGPLVYVQAGNAPITAYTLATGSKPGLTEAATGTTNAGPGGSLPIVSSNGATDDTGVVWLIRRSNPVELEAYNAVALGTPLYSANVGNWSSGRGNSFLTPMVANGRVYAPNYKTVSVFGLTE